MTEFRVSVHPIRPNGVLARWFVRSGPVWCALGSLVMSRTDWAKLKPTLAQNIQVFDGAGWERNAA